MGLPSSEYVRSELRDGVLEVVLDRPDRLNALIGESFDCLTELATRAAVDEGVRCVLLWATGRAFSVGDDLSGQGDRHGVPESDVTGTLASYTVPTAALLRLRKPTVVALQGPVYGGALEMALACDFRIADESVTLGPVYAQHGFASGTTLLPLFVGYARAKRILLRGEAISAEEASALGLVDDVVEGVEGAVTRARQLAQQMANGPTTAYALIKSALLQGIGRGPLEALHAEEDAGLASVRTQDAIEAERAFAEKRSPKFLGR